MKFQKDNSQVALTKEFKEQMDREKEELEKKYKEQQEETNRIKKRFWGLHEKYDKLMDNLTKRQFEYMPIDYQLDLLWHDMESGAIKVDKKKDGTWYKHIKSVKEKYPLKEDWRSELVELNEEMQEIASNTNVDFV